jgi:hypothetical protein
MTDEEIADEATDDPTPGRRRGRVRRLAGALVRSRRSVVAPIVVGGVMFAAITASAGSEQARQADIDGAQPIDYREECLKEGCSREEIQELWDSFHNECMNETCWAEEVFELAGGTHYVNDPYTWEGYIGELHDAFRERLGKNFTWPDIKLGNTDTLWTKIVRLLDGRTFTIAECDDSGCTYGPIGY